MTYYERIRADGSLLRFEVVNPPSRYADGGNNVGVSKPNDRAIKRTIDDLSCAIFDKHFKKYVHKISKNKNKYDHQQSLEQIKTACERAIKNHCELLIKAADVKKSDIEKVLKIAIKINRDRIANEVWSARKRLKALKQEYNSEETRLNEVRRFIAHALSAGDFFDGSKFKYPPVPAPTISPTPDGSGLPNESGIYFLWEMGCKVEYVGQSVRLSGRVRTGINGGGHYRIKDGDMISYILIPKTELTYAECFYIALCRPTRNGGTPCGSGIGLNYLENV